MVERDEDWLLVHPLDHGCLCVCARCSRSVAVYVCVYVCVCLCQQPICAMESPTAAARVTDKAAEMGEEAVVMEFQTRRAYRPCCTGAIFLT